MGLFKKVIFIAAALTLSASANADSISKLSQRSLAASQVLSEIMSAPDNGIPSSLLNKSTCVAVFPGVKKAAFLIGGRYGKGLVSCRVGRSWSAPAFLTLRGGSFGWQIGAQSTDLILVFVRPNAVNHLMSGSFTLGGTASVAAGPVGRTGDIGVDFRLDSDVYSYSRSKGIFAGLALQGTSLDIDESSDMLLYSNRVSTLDILSRRLSARASAGSPFVTALNRYAPARP